MFQNIRVPQQVSQGYDQAKRQVPAQPVPPTLPRAAPQGIFGRVMAMPQVQQAMQQWRNRDPRMQQPVQPQPTGGPVGAQQGRDTSIPAQGVQAAPWQDTSKVTNDPVPFKNVPSWYESGQYPPVGGTTDVGLGADPNVSPSGGQMSNPLPPPPKVPVTGPVPREPLVGGVPRKPQVKPMTDSQAFQMYQRK